MYDLDTQTIAVSSWAARWPWHAASPYRDKTKRFQRRNIGPILAAA